MLDVVLHDVQYILNASTFCTVWFILTMIDFRSMQYLLLEERPLAMCFQVLEQDRKIVNDDRVKFEVLASLEPHPVSCYRRDCFGFETVKKTIRQIWGSKDVIVSPGLHHFV